MAGCDAGMAGYSVQAGRLARVDERRKGLTMDEKKLREVVLESGIKVKPIYGPEDVADIDCDVEIGAPGEYPYTRGIHKYMYRYRPWTMRQYAGFGTPQESNQRFHYLITHGQNALNVAFDLPSQMGLDSDAPLAWGEVGRVGMAVDSLRDMEEAFEGIPLDKTSTSLTINGVAAIMMAMYFVVADKQGVPLRELRGTAQNDILKEYVGRGTWIFPVEPSIRLIGDTIEFCAEHVPHYYPVSVCGYHIRESGANPIQEIAYAYAIASAYVEHVRQRGVDVDDFVARLSFNFDIWGNLFEQVAKFRAARRLWAKLVRDKFGAANPRAMQMKMIAGGGGGGLTIEQPENNIVRGAYYALISALSGTQTMALCTYDEAYTIPTEKAALIGLRTMQILAEEMGLCDTVDPLAGSYYIERLTVDLEKQIVEEMEKVERLGGIVKAISEGLIQREVARQAYLYEQGIQSGEIIKVGVNKYSIEEEERDVELHEYRSEQAEEKIRRLDELRSERDGAEVSESLERLRHAAEGSENLMPYIMDSVRAYATVGEMTQVLKDVFGEFKEPVGL
jgi:methylmalonyl-CoA mutase N-terminal domain/subunit